MKIGDKVSYDIGNGLEIAIIIDIFKNGDIRTDKDGMRCNGEYTLIEEVEI